MARQSDFWIGIVTIAKTRRTDAIARDALFGVFA
jgi:hypothetical protein